MRILLLSDTHGHLDETILGHVREADEVWHAGDIGPGDILAQLTALKPLRAVYGNIDDGQLRREVPLDLDFEVAGLRVFMTHIGGYPGRYSPHARRELDARPGVGLFVCGHSHILKVMPDRKRQLLHMNPGACGVHGFHRVRTMLRFEVQAGKVTDLAAVELGLRGKVSRPA